MAFADLFPRFSDDLSRLVFDFYFDREREKERLQEDVKECARVSSQAWQQVLSELSPEEFWEHQSMLESLQKRLITCPTETLNRRELLLRMREERDRWVQTRPPNIWGNRLDLGRDQVREVLFDFQIWLSWKNYHLYSQASQRNRTSALDRPGNIWLEAVYNVTHLRIDA